MACLSIGGLANARHHLVASVLTSDSRIDTVGLSPGGSDSHVFIRLEAIGVFRDLLDNLCLVQGLDMICSLGYVLCRR